MNGAGATPKKVKKGPKQDDRASVLSGLAARLESHAAAIDGFVDLIPAKYYFPIEFTDEEMANKFAKNKKNKAPKQDLKEASRKGKKARLDPANAKSTTELQLERKLDSLAQQDGEEEEDDEDAAKADDDAEEDEEDAGDEQSGDETGAGAADEKKPAAASKPTGWLGTLLLSAGKDPKSSDELRSRLQQRIEELRAKRKAPEKQENSLPRKKQKKQAEDDRDKARKDRQKEHKKEKRKAEQQLKKEEPADDNALSLPDADQADASLVEEGDFSFSKFDFSTGQPVPSYLADHVKKRKKASTEDLLKKAEQHKLLLQQIKGTQEGEELMKREAYKTMMARAQGEKVKDNPALLKKTLKREQKQKQKSGKAWAERKSMEKKQQDQRQDKRQKNIQEKIQQKKDRRMGKKAPKPKGGPKMRRPGFEGRKKGFINKKPGGGGGGGGGGGASSGGAKKS